MTVPLRFRSKSFTSPLMASMHGQLVELAEFVPGQLRYLLESLPLILHRLPGLDDGLPGLPVGVLYQALSGTTT